jgi:hypothetical protein
MLFGRLDLDLVRQIGRRSARSSTSPPSLPSALDSFLLLPQVMLLQLSSVHARLRPSRLHLASTLLRPRQSPSPALSRMFALTPYQKNQPRTLSRQKELPRLPVPKLEASLDRYIKSLRPLLLEKALKEGKGEEAVEAGIRQREEWAQDFAKQGGLGRLLQERLKGESVRALRAAVLELTRPQTTMW